MSELFQGGILSLAVDTAIHKMEVRSGDWFFFVEDGEYKNAMSIDKDEASRIKEYFKRYPEDPQEDGEAFLVLREKKELLYLDPQHAKEIRHILVNHVDAATDFVMWEDSSEVIAQSS